MRSRRRPRPACQGEDRRGARCRITCRAKHGKVIGDFSGITRKYGVQGIGGLTLAQVAEAVKLIKARDPSILPPQEAETRIPL